MAQAIDDAVIVYIQGQLNGPTVVPQSKPTIFPVEDRLKDVYKTHYEPKKVSIGPIHLEKQQVKSMEEHKGRLLKELLDEKVSLTLKMLVEEVRKKEADARRCYSSESLNNGHDFLGTMILDGCFIIQLIRNYQAKKPDPILVSHTLVQIIHDLLLFENQLPFFVLTALFDKINTGNPTENLRDLILPLVRDIVPWFDNSNAQLLPEPNHLLELVYRCILIKNPSRSNGGAGQGNNSSAEAKKIVAQEIHIYSASKLQEINWIHLRRSEYNRLTFAGDFLILPPLQVSGETEPLLRNLMAYEQLQLGDDHPRQVIDYVFFLCCLAKSTEDIQILRHQGIIKNYFEGDEQILKMIGRLGSQFMRSPDYTYTNVFQNLNKHCDDQSRSLLYHIKRLYIDNPRYTNIMISIATLWLTAMQLGVASIEKKKGLICSSFVSYNCRVLELFCSCSTSLICSSFACYNCRFFKLCCSCSVSISTGLICSSFVCYNTRVSKLCCDTPRTVFFMVVYHNKPNTKMNQKHMRTRINLEP